MKMELMADLYERTLKQLLDGEKQMLEILPKTAKAISDRDMAALFVRHTNETKRQIQRLERLLGGSTHKGGAKAQAVSGLIGELKSLLAEGSEDPQILDAALAEAATQMEGHEVAAYACAHKYARFLGRRQDMKLLEQSFKEEQEMEAKVLAYGDVLNKEEARSEAEGALAR